jgi:hypothetical protein
MTDPAPEVAAGTAQEPLACPFCGGRAYATRTVNGTQMFKVGCASCGIEMKAAWYRDAATPTKDILALWNQRAALPSAPASPQTPRTESVWLWDAAKDGYWHQGEFVSADQLRWLLRSWPAAPQTTTDDENLRNWQEWAYWTFQVPREPRLTRDELRAAICASADAREKALKAAR